MQSITGKWNVVCLEIRTPDGWEVYEEYPCGFFTWTLESGILTEYIEGKGVSEAPYCYIEPLGRLYVDVSDTAEDGFVRECINNIYFIEDAGFRKIMAYDAENGEFRNPQKCVFRMAMER